ncbi:ankyrin repeat domain-containing protein [Burkholderia pseudomallei]|uniref:ankyrin repeat domain-containing protein n=1 Tax=Burkholderia pseudomallei TaxID=28450 RepID=UPI000F0868F7|nr:ankyrin repeat domain-containing protein [Burkholderia pseudomallei]CAJ3070006.1 ankyrin [Burkholderia pseudomallei]VCK73005.1 ankyrin [Burkholderia pseudomallei]VCK79883.1 ankyrin [Burkholderia pseudomallei]VCK80139.1 ankyrin [Burkholderia pseudomallei]VCK80893.1 ankyrin [Burkholderia pseudomallei]
MISIDRNTASPSATIPLVDTTPGAMGTPRSSEEQAVLDARLRLAVGMDEQPLQAVLDALRAGANPNSVDDYEIAPIHLAARWGTREKVEALVRAGATLSLQDGLRATPLHWAAHFGNADAFRALAVAGASLTARDAMGGRTAEQAFEANLANLPSANQAAMREAIAWAKERAARMEQTAGAPVRATAPATRQADRVLEVAGFSR